MDREVQYKITNEENFEVEIECPVCHNIIHGYKDTIDEMKLEWRDGYMHFVCTNCKSVLKVK